MPWWAIELTTLNLREKKVTPLASTRSRSFTPTPTRLPCERQECARRINPYRHRASVPGDLQAIRPGSNNPDIPEDTQSRTGHPASIYTEDLSCGESTVPSYTRQPLFT